MLKCRAEAIENFHGLLKSLFAPHLEGDFSIDQAPHLRSRAWKDKFSEGNLIFDLWSKQNVYASHPSRTGPVIGIRHDDWNYPERFWASWREVWRKERKAPELTLQSAGFTFYWGRPTSIETVLFRAEWPEIESAKHSGHPHWQFDWEQGGLSLERVHFGMSGWQSKGEFPECWQLRPGDPSDVRNWAAKTLEYVRSELKRYPPNAGRG